MKSGKKIEKWPRSHAEAEKMRGFIEDIPCWT